MSVDTKKALAPAVGLEHQFTDKLWYNRHLVLRDKVLNHGEEIDPDIWKGALKSAKKMEDQYGFENLFVDNDFEWGILNGKISALRWLTGLDWDYPLA